MPRKKAKWLKSQTYDLNEFANMCGFFNGNTAVNNYYGCNHPEQTETELQKIGDEEGRPESEVFVKKIIYYFLRKKYGCYHTIQKALETEEGKTYYLDLQNKIDSGNKELLSQVGIIAQGKCYGFSCPLAHEVDDDCVKPYETIY